MKLFTRKFLLLAALTATIAPTASARYIFDPSNLPSGASLSGRLIVRPLQANAVPNKYDQVRVRAIVEIQSRIISTIPQLDLYVIDAGGIGQEKALYDELEATGLYEYVQPDYILEPIANTNDPAFSSQWHLPRIEAQQAWDFGFGNNSIIIAVTDSGVLTTHPDLAARMVLGFNAVVNLAQAVGGQVGDLNGHGTHVAGCAAAINNNGIGVSSPAGGVRIMPIRVSDISSGSASSAALALGATWAADNGARVISASYSGGSSSTVQTSGAYARTKNALYLYAAGNDNRNLTTFDHVSTIMVGASDQALVSGEDAKASFSAFGPGMDIFAPGVNILATTFDGGYGFKSGTSMATPVANGVVAMIMLSNPTLNPERVETLLEHGCEDMGTLGNDGPNGWGRTNMRRSVVLAKQGLFRFNTANNSYYERVPVDLNAWYANVHSTTYRNFFGLTGTSANMLNTAEVNFVASAYGAGLNNLWIGGFASLFSAPLTTGDASAAPPSPISTYNSTSTHAVAPQFLGSAGAWRWRPVDTTTNSGFLVEFPSTSVNLGMNVVLLGRTGPIAAPAGSIVIDDNTGSLQNRIVNGGLNTVGTFRRGPVSMRVKVPGYLTTQLSGTISPTGLTGLIFALRAGDVDNDNFVGLDDFNLLSDSFNLEIGEIGYIATADFDGDGFVGLDDFNMLSNNFNLAGD